VHFKFALTFSELKIKIKKILSVMKKILSFIQRNNFISSVLGSATVVILFKSIDFLFLKSNLRIKEGGK